MITPLSATSATTAAHMPSTGKGLSATLTMGALGVVYGDIGTSPLYAFRAALGAAAGEGGVAQPVEVLGVLSLILWALMLVVSLKYVVVLLRIDNHGEGGPLALMTLVRSAIYGSTLPFLAIGMAATAFFFGDCIITPAISVLSAVEGLEVVAPGLAPYILPLTAGIIMGLFLMQSHGTARVSTLFGPITAAWFVTLAAMGFSHIGEAPEVLKAINPFYALSFMFTHGAIAFVTLGAVFLAVTGAEALYTDLGHFGKGPIRLAWVGLVLPSLALNYLGQAALVLKNPAAQANPFFLMVGPEYQFPLVMLATVATIIASQAVITGAFSLARQAVNLGLLPRLAVRHTSDTHSGQIYMPQVNYLLMGGVLLLVFMFRTSDSLAAAYGISVTGAMFLDSIMIFFVALLVWEWSAAGALLFAAPLLAIDGAFLASNLLKIADGGWVPVLVAGTIFMLMWIWIRGRIILNGRAKKREVKLDAFIRSLPVTHAGLARVPGTAFFLSGDAALVPPALLQNMRHNHVLHEKNIILAIRTEPLPYVDPAHRCIVTHINDEFSTVVMRFGFQETPDVQEALFRLDAQAEDGLQYDWQRTSLFLSRRVVRAHPRYGMPLWQSLVFKWLNDNASDPSSYYRLPLGRVIEIGRHVLV